MDLTLYRIKAFLPGLFEPALPPSAVVRRAIEEKPTTVETIHRVRWHIGNVQSIDDNGLYFALGRAARASRPVLDPNTGDFLEEEAESAPYTHVVLDVPSEVCAIARRADVAPTAHALGNRLERVLNASLVGRQFGAQFEVTTLSDPEEFVQLLRSAYAIRRFTVTFTRPNPFDADEDWHKPMARLTQSTNGERGSATVSGQALNEGPLEELTRSVASTGDDARARLVVQPDQRPVTRSLRGDTAVITESELDTPEQRLTVLQKLRAKYRSIRGTPG